MERLSLVRERSTSSAEFYSGAPLRAVFATLVDVLTTYEPQALFGLDPSLVRQP